MTSVPPGTDRDTRRIAGVISLALGAMPVLAAAVSAGDGPPPQLPPPPGPASVDPSTRRKPIDDRLKAARQEAERRKAASKLQDGEFSAKVQDLLANAPEEAGAPRFAALDGKGSPGEVALVAGTIAAQIRQKQCWSIAPSPAPLAVRLELRFNRDGSLAAEPRLLDRAPPRFREAAASAVRAVKKCAPFVTLPAADYERVWKHMIYTLVAPAQQPATAPVPQIPSKASNGQ